MDNSAVLLQLHGKLLHFFFTSIVLMFSLINWVFPAVAAARAARWCLDVFFVGIILHNVEQKETLSQFIETCVSIAYSLCLVETLVVCYHEDKPCK